MGLLVALASYVILWVLATLVVAGLVLATLWKRSSKQLSATKYHSGELFVIARGSGNVWLLTWSFLQAVNGAWMVASYGSSGYSYGLVGILFYVVTTAMEPLVCVVLSTTAYKQLQQTTSFSESVGARYGPALEAVTVAVMLLVTTLCLAVEYMAMADIFAGVMGISRLIVFGFALLFSFYTTFIGGALVGMIMAQLNGIIALVAAAALLGLFLDSAKVYRPSSTRTLLFGANTRATLLSFPGLMYFNITFGAFGEAFWQKRLWCRQPSMLWPSAVYQGILATAIGLLWGFAGMVASWKDAAEGSTYSADKPYILYTDRYCLV